MYNNKIKGAYIPFLTGYLLFYILMRFSFSMQTGSSNEVPGGWLLTGILGLGHAFFPYYILQRYYPSPSLIRILLKLTLSVALPFLIHLLIAQLLFSLSFNQFIDTSYQLLVTLSFYGIGFYFIRYSHLKKVQANESEIREKENMMALYRHVFAQEQVLDQLEKIEALVKNNPSAALNQIEQFSDELQQMIYSINKSKNE